MNKKILVIGALAAVGFFLFGGSAKAATTTTQVGTAKVGFNLDGSPRQLTDAEATAYLQNNPDLSPDGTTTIQTAKEHWIGWGYKENRVIFA